MADALPTPDDSPVPRRRGRPRTRPVPTSAEEARQQEAARKKAYRERKRAERAAETAVTEAAPDAGVVARLPHTPDFHRTHAGNQYLITRYLNVRATKISELSRLAYEGDLAGFACTLGDRTLEQATETDVANWFNANMKDAKDEEDDPRPWTRRTARRKLSALQGFYTWALREELITKNPLLNIEIRKPATLEPLRLTEDQVAKLFKELEIKTLVSEPRVAALYVLDAAVLALCYYCGLRVSEACGLRIRRIRQEVDGRVFTVVRKGDKVHKFPLEGAQGDYFDRWMRRRDEITAIDPAHRDFAFVHPWHGRRISRKRVYERLRLIARRAGLPRDILERMSPHKLRHAAGYHTAEREDIRAAQALLGHSTITTTQIYAGHDEKARLRILRRASRRTLGAPGDEGGGDGVVAQAR